MMFRLQARNWALKVCLAGMLVVAITAISGTLAMAQDEKGKMDEKALSVLKAMSDYIGGSKTISFRARTFFDIVRESGIKIKAGRATTVNLKRPKSLHVQTDGDDGTGATIWYDGSKLTFWRRDTNQVMSLDFSGTTEEMMDNLIEKHDAQIPLADLIYTNMNESVKKDLLSAEYVGIRMVGGVKCHQLSFESPGVDWQLWVEADSTPVPRRLVMDFVSLDSQPQYMVQMNAWSIGGDIEDYNFVAAVPESAKKVEFKLAKP